MTGRSALELEALHDCLAMLPSVSRALSQREAQLLTQHTLQAEVAARRAAIQEAQLQPGGRTKRVRARVQDTTCLECTSSADKCTSGWPLGV